MYHPRYPAHGYFGPLHSRFNSTCLPGCSVCRSGSWDDTGQSVILAYLSPPLPPPPNPHGSCVCEFAEVEAAILFLRRPLVLARLSPVECQSVIFHHPTAYHPPSTTITVIRDIEDCLSSTGKWSSALSWS